MAIDYFLPPLAGAAAAAAGAAAAPSSAVFFFFLPPSAFATRTFGRPSGLRPAVNRSSSVNRAIRSARVSTLRDRDRPSFTFKVLSTDTALLQDQDSPPAPAATGRAWLWREDGQRGPLPPCSSRFVSAGRESTGRRIGSQPRFPAESGLPDGWTRSPRHPANQSEQINRTPEPALPHEPRGSLPPSTAVMLRNRWLPWSQHRQRAARAGLDTLPHS